MAFGGFGSTPTSSAFGTSAFGGANKPTSFGTTSSFSTFGSTAPTTGFGGTTSTTFGAPITSSAFGGSSAFGAPATSSAFGGAFNAPASQPAFGSNANPPAFGAFGGGTTSTFGGGSSFGGPAPAFGTFGGGMQQQQPPFGMFQQQQQQQQQMQQPVQSSEMQLYNAVTACSVFGDDRDALLARWNLLQASWGVGKAVFHASAPPVTLSPSNQLCRFKAVGYSSMPKADKENEGQLSCIARKKPSELEKMKPQLVIDLSASLGNKPNIRVNIDAINGYDLSDLCEVIMSVSEVNPANNSLLRKVSAAEVMPTFSQPAVTQGLMQKYAIEGLGPRCAYTEDQLRDYLENPPMGIDPRLWRQAQLDNPDPKNLIPVPMIGFRELQTRLKCQEMQAKNQQNLLDTIATDISKLQKNLQETSAKLTDAKRKQIELCHRVLKVIIGQEVTRKRGYTIQPEEETLRIQLEALQTEMSAPTQFKGRLNELLSQVRLASQANAMSGGGGTAEKYNIDPFIIGDIKTLLKQQQDGLQALVTSIKQDMTDLHLIEQHNKA